MLAHPLIDIPLCSLYMLLWSLALSVYMRARPIAISARSLPNISISYRYLWSLAVYIQITLYDRSPYICIHARSWHTYMIVRSLHHYVIIARSLYMYVYPSARVLSLSIWSLAVSICYIVSLYVAVSVRCLSICLYNCSLARYITLSLLARSLYPPLSRAARSPSTILLYILPLFLCIYIYARSLCIYLYIYTCSLSLYIWLISLYLGRLLGKLLGNYGGEYGGKSGEANWYEQLKLMLTCIFRSADTSDIPKS